MELGRDLDAGPGQYVEVISTSNSLAAKVLSSVNSSWFGVRQPVKRLVQAVNLLGMVSVRILAITHCLAAIHERIRLPDRLVTQCWQASVIKAEAAKYLAERTDESIADEAFLVGLMQDMLVPLMRHLKPELYEARPDQPAPKLQTLCLREIECFGMDHGQAASRLAARMGLPASLGELMAIHHDATALLKLGGNAAVADATRFAGLFPHVCTTWAPSEASEAARLIEQHPVGMGTVDEAMTEIGDRAQRLASMLRPIAEGDAVDLPALMADATKEVAWTTGSLLGQVHSMMSNATQATSQLSAVNAEAMRLQEQTKIDALTGVLNRLGLDHTGPEEWRRLAETNQSVLLMFADLDDFKSVNDAYGHDKGDEALQRTAEALAEAYGPTAVVGRYGGDEFVVLLGGVPDQQTARKLGRKVVELLRPGITTHDGRTISLGVSIGGIWSPAVPRAADFHKMLAMADSQMYEVKAQGDEHVMIKTVVG
ncbi:MAG: diguanylate cyclase [Planctomycetes bacterium]|nr:diguanylate cyclase [Planctomycetota bacterium]